MPVTVTELLTDTRPRVGQNTILIAMTREDANYLKDILKHYDRNNETIGETKLICRELLDRMNECFPKS